MDTIDRRNLIAASGLALALAGCRGAGGNSSENSSSETNDGDLSERGFVAEGLTGGLGIDPAWNIGFNPKNPHPGRGAILGPNGEASRPGTTSTFDPDHVAIFHFELAFTAAAGAIISVKSAHCSTVRTPTENNYASNEANIGSVINYFNGVTTTRPRSVVREYGEFSRLKFNAPHHVVIYMKNISIYPAFPIIFGGARVKKDGNGKALPGVKNGSFFDVAVLQNGHVQQPSTGNYSTELIYAKNYFHYYDEQNGIQPISGHNEYWHAMNIVTTVTAADGSGLVLPVIIDPDTGNMGGGTEHP